jgi:hypothetical protein
VVTFSVDVVTTGAAHTARDIGTIRVGVRGITFITTLIIWAMNVWLMCIVGISIAATIAGRGVPLAISAGLAPQVMTL